MNPLLQIFGTLLVFIVLIGGLGLPWVARSRLSHSEKITAAAALGVLILHLAGGVVYAFDWSWRIYLLLFPLAGGLVFRERQACREIVADPGVRRLIGAYLIATIWSLFFLALISNYSGASWAVDWAGHYNRSLRFVEHRPLDVPFPQLPDVVPSRPPLANLVTAGFLTIVGVDFPRFQIVTTLLCSLAFLPGWLLTARLAPQQPRATAWFTVLYMLNASILENSTFAWTKLPTVFFVLSALYFLVPALRGRSVVRVAAGFALGAAGFLTHYSAGPYLVALVVAYVAYRRAEWLTGRFWREAFLGALPSILLLATWFGPSVSVFGMRGTFLSNSSVTDAETGTLAAFVEEKGLNLIDSMRPHFVRPLVNGFIDQESPIGFWRDYFFLLYQVNLPFMCGSVAVALIVWLLVREWRRAGPAPPQVPGRGFWLWFTVCSILLGTAASGGRDELGIAHLCLVGLLVLALAFLAARVDSLPRAARVCLAAGLGVDFILGVGLHFYVQSIYFSPLDFMTDMGQSVSQTYGFGLWANLYAKTTLGLSFLGDATLSRPIVVLVLACLLGLALLKLRPERPGVVSGAEA